MTLAISFILIFYMIVHIVKLEVFPFYLFAMYSQEYTAQDYYTSYAIYLDGHQLKSDEVDNRKFTYIMNTIAHYDEIKLDGVHGETEVITKFTSAIGSETLHRIFISPHHYEDIDASFGQWLSVYFEGCSTIRIDKELYNWDTERPKLHSKTTLYEVD